MRKAMFCLSVLLVILVAAERYGAAKSTPKVEIYGTSWCPNCRKAEAYFRKKKVAYKFYDIEKDKAAFERVKEYTAHFGVPIVIIDGEVIEGYSPDSYDDYIK